MKKLLLFSSLLLLLTSQGFGQAPYTGGQGDGYASQSLLLSQPAQTGTQVTLVQSSNQAIVRGIRSQVKWELYAADGKRVFPPQTRETQGNITIELPGDGLAAGVYLLRVWVDDQQFVRKWVQRND